MFELIYATFASHCISKVLKGLDEKNVFLSFFFSAKVRLEVNELTSKRSTNEHALNSKTIMIRLFVEQKIE